MDTVSALPSSFFLKLRLKFLDVRHGREMIGS
jgi:hypothetical protein